MPEACPDCGSVTLARTGAGSERIEAVIAGVVSPLPVFRLDSDATARAEAHVEILERF
jgi:primosomal protein N' (replication factor Y)